MNLDKVNAKKTEQAKKLSQSIQWVIKVRDTWSPVQIRAHLLRDQGKDVSLSTVKRVVRNLRLRKLQTETVEATVKKQQAKIQRKEIKVAVKAEREHQFPYAVHTPCEHQVKLEIKANRISGCGNCGCTYNPETGKFYNRFTDKPWGVEAEERGIGYGVR